MKVNPNRLCIIAMREGEDPSRTYPSWRATETVEWLDDIHIDLVSNSNLDDHSAAICYINDDV